MSPLSRDAAMNLLALARESIARALRGEPLPRPTPGDPLLREAAGECGAFVTLKKDGVLRGCIGQVESSQPLWETVARMARSSAFDDPRFAPLAEEELERVEIEVSVMTPLEPLQSPEGIEPGVHGVAIELGGRRALFLPQVAAEQGWDRETLLEQLCAKAGLPAGAWADPEARLHVFRAEIVHA